MFLRGLFMAKKKNNQVYGFVASELDGSEHIFEAPESLALPEEYDYRNFLSTVLDQGSSPICVPCSLSTWVNWRINMRDGSKKDHAVKTKEFFRKAGGTTDGMTFKDALHYLRHNGIETDEGNKKIQEYAMIRNHISLRNAIIANGPCVIALPVYDDTGYRYFWDDSRGYYKGGHAVSVVGWTKEGFIIRNSWGKYFGDWGYVILPYKDFNKVLEAWTIVR